MAKTSKKSERESESPSLFDANQSSLSIQGTYSEKCSLDSLTK